MSEVPAQIKAPLQPQVNLMPPEVGERRRTSRRRGAGVALLVLFLFVLAGLYALIWFRKEAATAEAAAEAERTAELQAEIASYSEVDVVKAQLANAESARQYAAAIELFWPLLIASIQGAMPSEVDPDEYVVSMPSFGGSPTSPESPFGRAPVGRLTFTINLAAPVDAVPVVDQLNTVPFFERARASVITTDTGEGAEGGGPNGPAGWVLEGSVDLNYDILMQRYSALWFGADGADSLEEYYQSYYEGLLAGQGVPPGYPPLPVVTPPPFIPGQSGVVSEPEPTASPTPSEEVAS
jgi:hypothetical protein